jgi:hypothetical protein
MDDKENYLRWLEEMWSVHKFDPHGGIEREEKRKEEVLEIFEDFGEAVKPPSFPPWNRPGDGRDGRPPEAP